MHTSSTCTASRHTPGHSRTTSTICTISTTLQNTKLSSSTATPAPNASSIWIELVAAVKVVEIEERREIAAGHGLARARAIRCRCGS